MTKVAILPVSSESGELFYQGVSGEMRSEGRTPGEALDAPTRQFGDDRPGAEVGLLVVVQGLRPDRFSGEEQQTPMAALMKQWRTARDQGRNLARAEQEELDALMTAELNASGFRAAALADKLRP